jgi:hypothetical protein
MSNFDKLAAKLSERPGVTNPKALAAYIGRKRYGQSVMSQASKRGVSAKTIVKGK